MAVKKTATRSQEFSDSVIDTIREPLIALDHNLRVVNASRSFYKYFKVKPEETVGQLIYDLGDKQWDIPKLRELLETILPEKTTFDDYEVEHDFASIGKRIMLLNARQIKRESGKEKIILLAIEDVTERKQLEELLEASEERFRRLFETASDGIVLLEKREGKITNANPAAEKMLGYSAMESLDKKLQDIGISLDMDDFQTTMQNLNKTGILNYDDVPVETRSGKHIDTDIYLTDRARLVQCNIRDITGRKQAEEQLRQGHRELQALMDVSPIGICWADMKGNIQYNNKKFRDLFGYTVEDIPTIAAWRLLAYPDPAYREQITSILSSLTEAQKQGKEADPIELNVTCKDGSIRHVLQAWAFTSNRILVTYADITERRQTEEDLRVSEEKYRTILEDMEDVYFEVDIKGNITFVNPSSCRKSGYSEKELLRMPFKKISAPDDIEMVKQYFGEIFLTEKTGKPFLWNLVKKNGEQGFFELVASLIRDKQGNPIGFRGIGRDITERRLAEEELKRTLESLKKAVATTIQVLVSALEARDPYTAGHQLRVAHLASAIAVDMGLPKNIIDGIGMAGSIHDIGKLSIPAEILAKPTKLTNLEFLLIKEHSQSGYEMLKNVESPWPLAQIVYQHHERMNGTGYPRNLKGDEILMEARIMAVADVVEAMASHRPYRPSLGIEAALEEIEKNKGILYDATVADACLKLFREKGYKLVLK